jgi:hypothetical protein
MQVPGLSVLACPFNLGCFRYKRQTSIFPEPFPRIALQQGWRVRLAQWVYCQ